MTLEWQHGNWKNPRLHYLYRGGDAIYCGMVSMLGDPNMPRGYSVYQNNMNRGGGTHEYITTVPTLDEAKMLLQTIAGAQL